MLPKNETAPEENNESFKSNILDMPLGGENPNPGFLTDTGAPYSPVNKEENELNDNEENEETTS